MKDGVRATLVVIFAALSPEAHGAVSIAGVAMPAKPVFAAGSFPTCALDYTRLNRFEAQIQSVQDCINDLEAFNSVLLPDYVQQMKRYVSDLQATSATTIKNRKMPWDARQKVADYVRDETVNSDVNNGMYFTQYRYYVAKYKSQLKSLLAVRARQQFPTN